MAGSYNHATTSEGKFRSNMTFRGMVENGGDAYEMAEEMYGMIWWLASGDIEKPLHADAAELVEMARQNYRAGLEASPGVQKGRDGDDLDD